jgi:hypothetical protein
MASAAASGAAKPMVQREIRNRCAARMQVIDMAVGRDTAGRPPQCQPMPGSPAAEAPRLSHVTSRNRRRVPTGMSGLYPFGIARSRRCAPRPHRQTAAEAWPGSDGTRLVVALWLGFQSASPIRMLTSSRPTSELRGNQEDRVELDQRFQVWWR